MPSSSPSQHYAREMLVPPLSNPYFDLDSTGGIRTVNSIEDNSIIAETLTDTTATPNGFRRKRYIISPEVTSIRVDTVSGTISNMPITIAQITDNILRTNTYVHNIPLGGYPISSSTAISNFPHHLNTTANIDGSYTIDLVIQETAAITYNDLTINGISYNANAWTEKDIESAKKSLVKQNLLIRVKKNVSRRQLISPEAENEMKARNTLRDMLSEADWRRYVTNGFIMVRGQSNRWYQIFHQRQQRIKIFKDGKCETQICIHSDSSVPPTDHVISMKILIELDEENFLKSGNLTNVSLASRPQIEKPQPNLVEAFKTFKNLKVA